MPSWCCRKPLNADSNAGHAAPRPPPQGSRGNASRAPGFAGSALVPPANGAAGACGGCETERNGALIRVWSKDDLVLQAGDLVLLHSGGGGGFGDPAPRSAAAEARPHTGVCPGLNVSDAAQSAPRRSPGRSYQPPVNPKMHGLF